MRALLALALLLAPAGLAFGQARPDVPAIAPATPPVAAPAPRPVPLDPARVGTPATAPAAPVVAPPATVATPARPRPARPRAAQSRPRDPRDRAYMDGGVPAGSGFQAPGGSPAPRRAELAPRPNLDLEGPRAAAPSGLATIQPTLIHPRLPGRSDVQDGGATQRENRLLQTPAPGARLSVPMTW